MCPATAAVHLGRKIEQNRQQHRLKSDMNFENSALMPQNQRQRSSERKFLPYGKTRRQSTSFKIDLTEFEAGKILTKTYMSEGERAKVREAV